ncbi:GerAB/ArcD/ProY family transporter, partial [Neobacillus drentensis]
MEKAKISGFQLFVLIVLFEMGSALLLSPGSEAKQDAWIAILFGLVGGIIVFFIYYRLFMYYPDL